MIYIYWGGLKHNKDRGKTCKIEDKYEDGWCYVTFFHRQGCAMVHIDNLEEDEEDIL